MSRARVVVVWMMAARRAFRLSRSDRDESLFEGSESVLLISLPTEWRCDSRRGLHRGVTVRGWL